MDISEVFVTTAIGASANMLAIAVALLALVPILLNSIPSGQSAFFASLTTRRRVHFATYGLGFVVFCFTTSILSGSIYFLLPFCKVVTGVICTGAFMAGTAASCAASVWFIAKSNAAL